MVREKKIVSYKCSVSVWIGGFFKRDSWTELFIIHFEGAVQPKIKLRYLLPEVVACPSRKFCLSGGDMALQNATVCCSFSVTTC